MEERTTSQAQAPGSARRKESGTALRRAERRLSFLLGLNDQLRDIADPTAIMAKVAEALGRFLKIDRVGYGEIDPTGTTVTVHSDWHGNAIGTVAGRHRMNAFGPAIIDALKAGRTIRVDDVADDPRTAAPEPQRAFAAIRTRSVLSVPLVKGGRMTAMLYLHYGAPHAWSDDEVALAEDVAERTWSAVERARAELELAGHAQRLRLALSAARMGDWAWDAASDLVTFSERAAAIFGIAPGPVMTWTEMRGLLHPDDAERARAAVESAIADRVQYDIEYRVRRPSDGREAWVAAQGQAVYGPDGSVAGMIGVVQDVSERKRDEERQSLLIRELHHRVKNTLATVQAIVGSTARAASTVDEFYSAFVGRIVSLAHTHSLLTDDEWQTVPLRQLLADELRPYDEGGRIALQGPDVELPSDMAVPIGMAIHELTTNAAKYGALSRRTGRLEIAWDIGPGPDGGRRLAFAWSERGGPPVAAPKRQGFGSRLLQRVLTAQLEAEVDIAFPPEGLRLRMTAPLKERPRFLDILPA
jgi:PAS domain S-box-containing protein